VQWPRPQVHAAVVVARHHHRFLRLPGDFDQRLTVEELDVRRAAAQQEYDRLQVKLNG
jgi:hypothetical protein